MPLPLPNLDTRRWDDLVQEGQALIPQYAPGWTDHNAHDPGITLVELLAWLVEQDIFRLNQVPRRHLRKFLALAGYYPEPGHPARIALRFELKPGETTLTLPRGLAITGQNTLANGPALYFRTQHAAAIVPAAITALLAFDGSTWLDQTLAWREGAGYSAWGEDPTPHVDPQKQPAFYIGFDQALPVGVSVRLWLEFTGEQATWQARQALIAEAAAQEQACTPLIPGWACPGAAPAPAAPVSSPALPAHHSLRTEWEYFDGSEWQALDADSGQVLDDTRSFSLSGGVQLSLPGAMAASSPFSGAPNAFYIRCRMRRGLPDAAPHLAGTFINAVEALQRRAERHPFPIKAGVLPPAGQEPVPGVSGPLQLGLDAGGQITSLAFGAGLPGPSVQVLAYQPATATQPGSLTVTLLDLGQCSGYPLQAAALRNLPMAGGEMDVFTLEAAGLQAWSLRPDLDAAGPDEAAAMLDSDSGELKFGDGLRGRVPPLGARLLASYQTTLGAAGNLPARVSWGISGTDDALNNALTGGGLAAIQSKLSGISNPLSGHSGSDPESLEAAAGRAVEQLWAHERLLELAEAHQAVSLDQVSSAERLARRAPTRATTLLDFERLALETPGVRLRRARAFAGIDPAYPCLSAPGTVTVVILPELPARQPQPTQGLLASVRRYLERRRVIGARLLVVGPQYLQVSVRASVRVWEGSDPQRVQQTILQRLNAFLHPLSGGPDSTGWPFGRDVYRSEILQLIDGVEGVDHVLALELVPDRGEAQCANLCVGPTGLVVAGNHSIEAVR